jgi:hypothetical protein
MVHTFRVKGIHPSLNIEGDVGTQVDGEGIEKEQDLSQNRVGRESIRFIAVLLVAGHHDLRLPVAVEIAYRGGADQLRGPVTSIHSFSGRCHPGRWVDDDFVRIGDANGKSLTGGSVGVPDINVSIECRHDDLESRVGRGRVEVRERRGGQDSRIGIVQLVPMDGKRKRGVCRDGEASPASSVIVEHVHLAFDGGHDDVDPPVAIDIVGRDRRDYGFMRHGHLTVRVGR